MSYYVKSCDGQHAFALLMQERGFRSSNFQADGDAKEPSLSASTSRERPLLLGDSCTVHCLVQRVSGDRLSQNYEMLGVHVPAPPKG